MSGKLCTSFARSMLTGVALFALAGCGGGGSASSAGSNGPVVVVPPATPTPTPAPSPTPTPTPTPTPVPTPTPTPTASPVGGVLSGVLDEGDSISVFWGGNHTGIYAALRPNVPFYGRAVGGSGLASMAARFDADVVFKPKVVTILIGANDVSSIGAVGSPYQTGQQYLDGLFSYAAKWRASGAKVLFGTVLGQCQSGNPNGVNDRQNTNRIPVNAGIRAAVGTKIDAVIDYAADPVMGTDAAACDKTLFQDGVHPTDGAGLGIGGQGKLAAIYAPVVDRALQ